MATVEGVSGVDLRVPIKLLVDPKTKRCAQAEFINITKRHAGFSGGYGNGKSYAASLKAVMRLATFPKYRVAICRYSTVDLKRSTMSTFFKVCPADLYDPHRGGGRADSLNYTKLINGSEIFWMHLDDADEQTVRGLEVNMVIVDQAEEISENMYNHLSARVGRWDEAIVPQHMLDANPNWPRNPVTDKPMVPAQMLILCNPDSELHWIYKRYHPESLEHKEKYMDDYELVQASSTENPTLDPEVLKDMLSNDPVWVQRFVYGKWGIPGGAIHEVDPSSILEIGKDVSLEFIETVRRSGNLFRILDHGEASPTCCLWVSAYKDWFFFFREYYKPNALISTHRSEITELSKFGDGTPERYVSSWADPAIFKKTSQKYGGFWCEADEYSDPRIDAPALIWNPADNNELATRNRINEYLKLSSQICHPITGQPGASRIYFIKRPADKPDYPLGVREAILQTKAQKRLQIDTINGKPIFSDERDDRVIDHAYDPVRYFCAMHPFWSKSVRVTVPQGSFFHLRNKLKAMKSSGMDKKIFGDVRMGQY
jgi:hypothetical protein